VREVHVMTIGKQADIRLARDRFFAQETAEIPAAELKVSPVSSQILESWHRSRLYGLQPDNVHPVVSPDSSGNHQLARTAQPLIGSRIDWLTDAPCALTLTNSAGRILERWVVDERFAARLDARRVVPGYSVAESDLGTTSSGIALETGHSVLVTGYEHFSDDAVHMTSAGSAIRHPISRRIMGSLNLSCAVEDTTPLMLQWVKHMTELIERKLLDTHTEHERQVFGAYLTGRRDSRHPVVCLDEHTVVGNAAGARMMAGIDQAVLWEQALRAIRGREECVIEVGRTDGQPVQVTCRPILDREETVGAEVRFEALSCHRSASLVPPAQAGPDPLAGLAGRSAAWGMFRRTIQSAMAGVENLLVVGEPGTGKTAVLQALVAGADATWASGSDLDAERAGDAVRRAAAGVSRVLVVDDLQRAPEPGLRVLLAEFQKPGAPRLLAAHGKDLVDQFRHEVSLALSAWPGATVTVPALRERQGDVPVLVKAITAARTSTWNRPQWTSDALQALTRVLWPANVASIERLVTAMLRRRIAPQIRYTDLPAEILAMATRRELAGLERMEAQAIATALHLAEGNKKLAAQHLGVARSTLYRKMRALGLDLSGTTF
jgi:sigma-54 dependent transcriptional regulator, acetoin dehydrogenase operon transcriptional activator AcoR